MAGKGKETAADGPSIGDRGSQRRRHGRKEAQSGTRKGVRQGPTGLAGGLARRHGHPSGRPVAGTRRAQCGGGGPPSTSTRLA